MKKINPWLRQCAEAISIDRWFPSYEDRRKADRIDESIRSGMMFLFMSLWIALLLYVPNMWFNLIGVLWPTSAIAWMVYRIQYDMKNEGHDLATELVLLWKVGDIWLKIFFWPIDASIRLGCKRTLKDELWTKAHNEAIQCSGGYSRSAHDGLIRIAQAQSEDEISKAHAAARHIRELPQEIELSTRTAYACGATVITLTSAASASAQTVSTNRVQFRTDGFVAIVRHNDTPSDTLLSTAHVSATATDSQTRLFVFAELELTQVGDSKVNWLQMAYLGYKPNDTDEIRLGHIALAASWMEPPPFLEEPVSYPRIPYYFYGWGLQYDTTWGPWNFLVDIASDSSVRFDDSAQFNGTQASVRLKRKMNSELSLAVSGEMTETSKTVSLDASLNLTPQFYSRGTMYVGMRPKQTLAGMFITSVCFPSKKLGERFDLHCLVDAQNNFGNHQKDFRYSTGVRMQTSNKRWSATMDWVDGTERTDTIEMRFQHRF